jgi:hypothetical protein
MMPDANTPPPPPSYPSPNAAPPPYRAYPLADHLALLRGVLRHRLLGTILIGTVLGLGVLVVEVLYRVAPDPSDPSAPLASFERARDLPSRYGDSEVHVSLRLGLLVPVRLAQAFFGYSQAAYLAVPMLAGAALAVGTFVLGVLLFNRAVGGAAAVLVVASTPVFASLTVPAPELLSTALASWAVVLAVALRQGRALVSSAPWRQCTTACLVGLLLAWALLTSEVSMYAWPAVAAVLLRRLPVRRLAWAGVPLAVVAAADSLLNAILLGDPFARFRGFVVGSAATWPIDGSGFLPQPLAALLGLPEGPWLVAAVLATVAGVAFSRRLAFLAACGGLAAAPVLVGWLLGSGAATPGPYDGDRAWLPMVPAVALGGVAGAWSLVRWFLSRQAPGAPIVRASTALVAGAVCCALVVPPVVVAHQARQPDRSGAGLAYAANGGTQLEQFRTWLADHAGGVGELWADPASARLVPVFAGGVFGGPVWHGELEVWEPGRGRARPAPGAYVLFYRPEPDVCADCRAGSDALLAPFGKAPTDWQPAFASTDGSVQMYLVR